MAPGCGVSSPPARPWAWPSSAAWWPRTGQGHSASGMPGALSPASSKPRPSHCPHGPSGAQVSGHYGLGTLHLPCSGLLTRVRAPKTPSMAQGAASSPSRLVAVGLAFGARAGLGLTHSSLGQVLGSASSLGRESGWVWVTSEVGPKLSSGGQLGPWLSSGSSTPPHPWPQGDRASVATSQQPRCRTTSSCYATTARSSSPAWGAVYSGPIWTPCCSTHCLPSASVSSRPSWLGYAKNQVEVGGCAG